MLTANIRTFLSRLTVVYLQCTQKWNIFYTCKILGQEIISGDKLEIYGNEALDDGVKFGVELFGNEAFDNETFSILQNKHSARKF